MKQIILLLILIGLTLTSSLSGQGTGSEYLFSKSISSEGALNMKSGAFALFTDCKMEESPSKAKAFLFSLILPGLGESYAGSKKMTRVFLGSELFFWTAYFSFRVYGDWKRHDYMNFAALHAGANVSGKNHKYFVNLENFDNIYDYNDAKLRQRDVESIYPENDFYSWEWDKRSNRLKYRKIRISSDSAYRNSVLIIGCIVANHLISGIDALRLAAGKKSKTENLSLGFYPLLEGGVKFSIIKNF